MCNFFFSVRKLYLFGAYVTILSLDRANTGNHTFSDMRVTCLGKPTVKSIVTHLFPFPEEVVVWVWEETVRM